MRPGVAPFADDGTVRTPYKRIFGALSSADESDLAARVDALGAADPNFPRERKKIVEWEDMLGHSRAQ